MKRMLSRALATAYGTWAAEVLGDRYLGGAPRNTVKNPPHPSLGCDLL